MVTNKLDSSYIQNDSGRCVLYIAEANQLKITDRNLLAAQSNAIKNNLPLAVVVCLQIQGIIHDKKYAASLASLERAEALLADLNIPLMALIGDPLERLKGMIHHTQPRAVYFESGSEYLFALLMDEFTKHVKSSIRSLKGSKTAPQQLIEHPVTWPGVVISIKQLRVIF